MWIARIVMASALLGCAPVALCERADVQKQLEAAATEVTYLSFDRALPMFAEVAKATPEGSEPWQAATFGEAVCLQQMAPVTADRLEQASGLYRQLAEKYAAGKYGPQAMMALGRIAELVDYLGDKPDLPAARGWYEKARAAARENSELGHEATLRIAATYVQTYDVEQVKQGVAILEEWLQKYPDNSLASAMWQYLGDTYFWPLKQEKQAITCYMKADAKGLVDAGREGPVYWCIANLAERNGERDVAIQYYTKIITKTPGSGKAYESQLALKRLGAPVPPIKLFEKANKSANGATTGVVSQ